MTDIDRQKLRELCECATPGPWRWWTSCSWRRLSSDARGNDRNGKPLDRDGGIICPYVCRDGHPDLIITEKDADFIAAARTALPALLDLTDAQAAKIAELEAERRKDFAEIINSRSLLRHQKARIASLESERDQLKTENASLRERADAPEDRTWFWEIVDRDGLANVASDERQALADICRAAAERDQLRKQVEALPLYSEFRKNWPLFCDADVFENIDTFADRMEAAGLIETADVEESDLEDAFAYERGLERGGQKYVPTVLGNTVLSAASALEQKEQG